MCSCMDIPTGKGGRWMQERDSFVFYRSFRDAIDQMPAKDQLPILKAIIDFGLDGTEPAKLTPTQNAFYVLVKPILQKGRNKAANGKKGGSKPKANGKQNESKGEDASGLLLSDNNSENREGVILTDYDGEDMREGEGMGAESNSLSDEELFSAFWEAYPACARRRREAAWEIWKKLKLPPWGARKILDKLEEWKTSRRWTDDGGAFIPNPENFLNPKNEYLSTKPVQQKASIPKGASGRLGEAEREAIENTLNGSAARHLGFAPENTA